MILRNFKRYKLNDTYDESTDELSEESSEESSEDSLVYSESSNEEIDTNNTININTPRYSFLNRKAELLKIRQNPDESRNRQCHRIFTYPTFDIKLNNSSNRIDSSIIDDVRKNFKIVMNDIQKGELTISKNEDEFLNFEDNSQDYNQYNNSRKRAYSLDIQHVEECIRNGTILC